MALEPAKVIPTYNSFLIDKINRIYDSWDEGNPEMALMRALRLVVFLPRELKAKLEGKQAEIMKDLKVAYAKEDVDWFTTQRTRNRVAKQISILHLEPFIDEMTTWLDQRGYFEEQRRVVPVGNE